MRQYNAAMRSVRISVKWLFGGITAHFKYIDFNKNLKLMLNSVGKMFVVSAILKNAWTC